MNKTYKVIFNHVLGRFVVVSEIASRIQRGGIKAIAVAAAAVLAMGLGMGTAYAQDTGETDTGEPSAITDIPVHSWDKGNRSMSLGSNGTHADGESATAVGSNAHADGFGSAAMGTDVTASGQNSVAIGNGAVASGNSSIAIGDKADTDGDGIPDQAASATGEASIAIGSGAAATDYDAVSIGKRSTASEDEASAFGVMATASGEESTAVGTNTTAEGLGTLAGGSHATAIQGTDVAMGHNAEADAGAGTAIGHYAGVYESSGSAFGHGAKVQAGDGIDTAENGTAMGAGARAENEDAAAIGARAVATGERSIANGTESLASGEESSAFGASAEATAERSVAMGGGEDKANASKATGRDSVAVGSGSRAYDEGSVAIGGGGDGKGASAAQKESIAVGSQSSANGEDSTAWGFGAHVGGADGAAVANGTAFGTNAAVTAEDGTALGVNTSVGVEGGVALGADSVADRDAGMLGYRPNTGRPINEKSPTWTATEAAVSVGHDAYIDEEGNEVPALTRQITNVAAGKEDTDAVNVAQLKAAMPHYYSVNTNSDIDNDGKNDNNYLNEAAYIDPDAVYAMAAGVGVRATNDAATSFGAFAEANGTGSIALGSITGGEPEYKKNEDGEDAADEVSGKKILDNNTVVHGDNAIAIGAHTQVFSEAGIGMGTDTNVYNKDSVGIGNTVKTTGENATAVGAETEADTNASAYGYSAKAYRANATAIGVGAKAAMNSTAIGQGKGALFTEGGAHAPNSTAVGLAATTFGTRNNDIDNATGMNSTAIGAYAHAGSNDTGSDEANATAIGAWSKAIAVDAIGIGAHESAGTSRDHAGALAEDAIAIGFAVRAAGERSIAIGTNQYARTISGNDSVGIGYNVNVDGPNSVFIGSMDTGSEGAGAGAEYQVGIGYHANVAAEKAIAIGGSNNPILVSSGAGPGYTNATGSSAIGIGTAAVASSDGSIAIGLRATIGSSPSNAVAIGSADMVTERDYSGKITKNSIVSYTYPMASADFATAIGSDAQATNSAATAVGYKAYANQVYSTALGYRTTTNASGENAVAFGSTHKDLSLPNGNGMDGHSLRTMATTASAVAIGTNAQATAGARAIAIGSVASGNGLTLLASGEDTVAIGVTDTSLYTKRHEPRLNAYGQKSVAIGANSNTSALQTVSIGVGSQAVQRNVVVIGTNVTAGSTYSGGIYNGENAIAIGNDDANGSANHWNTSPEMNVSGNEAVGIGTNVHSTTYGTVAIGRDGQAVGQHATSFGEANAYARNSTAIGNWAEAGGGYGSDDKEKEGATAVGYMANAGGAGNTIAVALGREAIALAQGSVAAGYKAQTNGSQNVAIGPNTFSGGNNSVKDSIAIGYLTKATADDSIAIGRTYISSDESDLDANHDGGAFNKRAIAIGTSDMTVKGSSNDNNDSDSGDKNRSINAYDEDAIVIGTNTRAGKNDISIGVSSQAVNSSSIALGTEVNAWGDNSIAAGFQAQVGYNSVAMGNQANVYSSKATAVGGNTIGGGEKSVVVGQSQVHSEEGVVIGTGSQVAVHYSLGESGEWDVETPTIKGVVVGNSSEVHSNYGVIVGNNSQVTGDYSTAVGNNNTVYGEKSGVIGYQGQAPEGGSAYTVDGNDSYAIGNNTHTGPNDAFALGNNTEVLMPGGVAIGTDSLANRNQHGQDNYQGYSMSEGKPDEQAAQSATWKPTAAAVSVGKGAYDGLNNYSSTVTRRITDVAAGVADTDAVNVAQLKTLGLQFPDFKGNDTVDIVPANPDDPDDNTKKIHAWKTTVTSSDNSVLVTDSGDETKREHAYDVSVKYRVDRTGPDENGTTNYVFVNDNNEDRSDVFYDTDTTYGFEPDSSGDGNRYVFKENGKATGDAFVDTDTHTSVTDKKPVEDYIITVDKSPEPNSEGAPEYIISMDEKALADALQGLTINADTKYELSGNGDPEKPGKKKENGDTDYTATLTNLDNYTSDGDAHVTDTNTTYTIKPVEKEDGSTHYEFWDDRENKPMGEFVDTDTQYDFKKKFTQGEGDEKGSYHYELQDKQGNPHGSIDLENVEIVEGNGQRYGGDIGDEFRAAASGRMNLKGGISDANELVDEANIGIFRSVDEETGEESLNIRLAKNLKGLDSMQVNDHVSIGPDGSVVIDKDGIEIEGGPTIKRDRVDMAGKKIQNVGKGTASDDMVNVSQLQEMGDTINNRLNHIADRIDDVDDRASAGVAMGLAAAALPQVYIPGKNMTAIGAGTYRGEAGIAVGISTISDNGKWIVKGNATANSESHFGAHVGVGYLLQ